MNTIFDIPADLDTPTSVYLKLGPLGPRFLLESVEQGDQIGRYSFIGFGAGLEVSSDGRTIRAGSTLIETDGTMAGLMDGLRKTLASAPSPQPLSTAIPFHGGLVGAIGFDVAHRLVGSPPAASARPEIQLYGPPSLIVFDHLSRRAALLHDGPESDRRSLRREVMSLLAGGIPAPGRAGGFSPPGGSMTQEEYEAAVETARHHITEGDVYQIVPSVRFMGETDLDPFNVYRGLRLLNPSPYMYFCDLGETRVIGSSPEALVRLRGSTAELRPIAGTRPRHNDDQRDRVAEDELVADAKEAAEHVMLVDLARNDLGRVAVPGSIKVDPYRAIERYSHVIHLVSGVSGILEAGTDAFDLFAAAFPAGTVVGAPKIRALELLRELEPVPRGSYAGTVGYFGHGGTMDQAIAIRTIVMNDGTYSYQAGAGIVADSVPTSEWEEVLSKSGAMRGALETAAGGL
ncbi:MAG TPA: anthranilate synthase component I family protein [Acidimicrobiia bacterium]|nr:anthranilate synthase component I family protein [Acidimicrobiia bacterium]